jgi:citrate synthase
MSLKEKVAKKIQALGTDVKGLIKEHGNVVISECTVKQAYGGMRGLKCIATETSALDPQEGIRFRGYDIPQARAKLPKAKGSEEALPEGIFYLLITGDLPSEEEVNEVTEEWRERGKVPEATWKVLDSLPKDMHPMTQFSIGILSLQSTSEFVKRYNAGIKKTELWDPMYEDTMNLLAKLPAIAAYIYRRSYKDGKRSYDGQ